MSLHLLEHRVDHLRGERPPREWVARIDGLDARFGLARTFVEPMRDWSASKRRRPWHGLRLVWFLEQPALYEVALCEGKGKRRAWLRSFRWLDGGEWTTWTPEQVAEWCRSTSTS